MSLFTLCQWIETTSISTAIREGALYYPILGALHLAAIGWFGGMVLMGDLSVLGIGLHGPVAEVLSQFRRWKWLGFAVVLLTGDDVGGPKGSLGDALKLRGRQNVIFELGFFLGKYQPHRVCVLYEKEVELPSDFSGIGYVRYDDGGGWKMKLANEINAAGIETDLNLALGEP